MKCLITLSLFAFAGVAAAETLGAQSMLKALPSTAARPSFNMDGVFDRVMSAAGVGLTSGKIMLLRPMRCGRREQVAVNMGKSRLMPLFDLNFHGASVFAHVSF